MIRVVALGTSIITARTIEAAAPVSRLEFAGVMSRDAERAAAFARQCGVERGYGSLDEVLGDAGVDAVYVASPNGVHAEQARAALLAGKHVLVEKPAVGSVAEWDALTALARERGLVLLEEMRTAYDPVMTRIVELLPSLGLLRHAAFHFSQRSSRYDDVLAGRHTNIFDPAMGGGALADLGVYVFHPIARLFGLPESLTASQVSLTTGADGAGAALLAYPGMVVEGSWSKITRGIVPSTIEGELGSLSFNHVTELTSLTVEYLDGRRLHEAPAKASDNITHALERFATLTAGGGDARDDQRWTRDALALMAQVRAAMA